MKLEKQKQIVNYFLDKDILISKGFLNSLTDDFNPEEILKLLSKNPKTATLLFRSGKANCTGAKNIEDVRKTVNIIAEKLKKLNVDVYKDLDIVIQNIVAISDLGSELNLNEVAMGLGLENIEYEPEQFPGLVYRIKEPKVAMLLFGSGKIVCTGARQVSDVSVAVDKLSAELSSLDLLRKKYDRSVSFFLLPFFKI